jgi:hypothetical protein
MLTPDRLFRFGPAASTTLGPWRERTRSTHRRRRPKYQIDARSQFALAVTEGGIASSPAGRYAKAQGDFSA